MSQALHDGGPVSRAEFDQLARRLTRLEEVERGRGLLHRYAQVMDDPRAETTAALFTPDAELTTPSGTFQGRARIAEFYAGAIARDPSIKRHFITSPRATWLSAGQVRLEAYFLFTGRADGASLIGWGTYDAQAEVGGDEPLFASLSITPHLRTDLATGWPTEPGED